ncbi:MAG: hypothetical protein Q8P72_02605 [Candidatus Roizmanbacteria bacterium]|nr:hypothetical protein [Candidatus Roizmanbacteria bacterium]
MSIFHKIISSFRKRPFLFVLIGLLVIIAIVSLKPGYYLMGWDNYSSFFNQKTNLWRWFFHSWREFRGLGVPSDSEITELPRQLFFLLLSPFVSESLLEQFYFLASFCAGSLLMYVLFTKIVNRYEQIKNHQDIGGFVAALFYIFNLNTLSVFFFPITPYVTRFFAIPLLFLAFHTAITSKKLSWKQLIFLFLAVFCAAPSYVIGTVFVTIIIALGIFVLFQSNVRKGILISLIFGLLNLYWLLPFANYSIQKSDMLPLAPTFISANEAQLNKPASFYALDKQLMLSPNFFETTVTSITLDASSYLHPLADTYDSFPTYPFLLAFPLLYILGSILIIAKYKTYKHLLWIPSVIFLFIFLSLKEYSPLGFLYRFFSEYVPFFNVIFRFGDTKFHPFIAFAGSLAGGLAIIHVLSFITQYKKAFLTSIVYLGVALVMILVAIPFRYFLTGNLFGSFMYNKLPKEYMQIADIINSDSSESRVLHLPYDDEVYWRSYSWGYLGSSFLHYLLDKPLFEKTFEPASAENADVMEQVQRLLHNSQSLPEPELNQRAKELYDLISKLGIKYVILDGTVSTAQPTRGITLWGSFNYPEARNILETLRMNGYIEPVYEGGMKLDDYMNAYEKILPIPQAVRTRIHEAEPEPIVLYKLKAFAPKVEFLSEAKFIDHELEHELLVNQFIDADHTISSRENGSIYPFLRTNLDIVKESSAMNLTINNLQKSTYTVSTQDHAPNRTFLIELTGQIQDENVVITSYLHYLPQMNERVFRFKLKTITIPVEKVQKSLQDIADKRSFLANWHTVPQDKLTDLRVQINDTVLPIPQLDGTEQSLGYLIIDSENVQLSLLSSHREATIDTKSLKLTEKPNCYNDALDGYEYSVKNSENKTSITSQNGSTCFWQDLDSTYDPTASHFELDLSLQGQSENMDTIFEKKIQSSQPSVTQFIAELPKPNILQLCIKEQNVDSCFNSHQLLEIPESVKRIRIPTSKNISNIDNLLIFFALKNTQYQKQQIDIESITVHSYKKIAEETFAIDVPREIKEEISLEGPLKIHIPSTMSSESYLFDKQTDMLSISNIPCQQSNTYRTIRRLNGTIVSSVQNCQNQLFTEIPYSSNSFYLWYLDYNLASGKFPEYKLDDDFYTLKNEYLSLYQGYPDIRGFKLLQGPERLFQPHNLDVITNPIWKDAYTFQFPHPEYSDNKTKQYTVQQYSENEGIMLIDDFSIIELPNTWPTMQIEKKGNVAQFSVPTSTSFESILPSLKKITINGNSSEGDTLLKFNEGFDEQWSVYPSLATIILHKPIVSAHVRCDGYANCFDIPSNQVGSGAVLYLFYWPELLNFFGWIGTGITTIGILVWTVFHASRPRKM